MSRRRGDQRIQHPRSLDFIAPAQRLDHPLNMTAAFARVLDEVKILVAGDLLDTDEHWCPLNPSKRHHNLYLTVKLAYQPSNGCLAPQFDLGDGTRGFLRVLYRWWP
jgi:hypothetical protein